MAVGSTYWMAVYELVGDVDIKYYVLRFLTKHGNGLPPMVMSSTLGGAASDTLRGYMALHTGHSRRHGYLDFEGCCASCLRVQVRTSATTYKPQPHQTTPKLQLHGSLPITWLLTLLRPDIHLHDSLVVLFPRFGAVCSASPEPCGTTVRYRYHCPDISPGLYHCFLGSHR